MEFEGDTMVISSVLSIPFEQGSLTDVNRLQYLLLPLSKSVRTASRAYQYT